MPTSTMLRNRYVSDAVDTMSPGRLIVALYDRLALDLERAETAIGARDIAGAHFALLHAQNILCELLGSLDTQRWEAGAGLASLYHYMINELITANVKKDAQKVVACRELVEPLRDAWREAAGVIGPTAPRTAA
jgi:flagellar protein FliS